MAILWIVVGVAAVLLLWAVLAFNSLVRLRNEAEQGWANIDVQLRRRADLIPKFDPDLLERYDDLRRLKKGVGAAALVDGVCQGCHEQLSAVEVDRLKRADGIRRCDHCRRILVF